MTTRPPNRQLGQDRTALFRSLTFREHDTGSHPENAGRLIAIDAALERLDLLEGRPEIPFSTAPDDVLARVHDPRYIAGIREFSAQGGGWLDADTAVSPRSVDAAALAAAHALDRGLDGVLIVDWDVHHGNGTQDAFYQTDQVLFCSIHQWPLYPGTGAASERGSGRGAGYTLNVPLSPGADDDAYSEAFDQVILPAANAFRPQLVLISAGFDAHASDPLGSMQVTERGFSELTRRVVQLAEDHAEGRVVAFLEGGYDPAALASSVVATLVALDGDDASLANALRPGDGGTESRHNE
jgi:acetoin utilization deacetylase AcuC-like enzyme